MPWGPVAACRHNSVCPDGSCPAPRQTVLIPDFDARNKDQILEACDGANLVINLLGIHQETWNFNFDEVHVDFARSVAEAAAATSTVERMLHVSCLGAASKAPSVRLQTKARYA